MRPSGKAVSFTGLPSRTQWVRVGQADGDPPPTAQHPAPTAQHPPPSTHWWPPRLERSPRASPEKAAPWWSLPPFPPKSCIRASGGKCRRVLPGHAPGGVSPPPAGLAAAVPSVSVSLSQLFISLILHSASGFISRDSLATFRGPARRGPPTCCPQADTPVRACGSPPAGSPPEVRMKGVWKGMCPRE